MLTNIILNFSSINEIKEEMKFNGINLIYTSDVSSTIQLFENILGEKVHISDFENLVQANNFDSKYENSVLLINVSQTIFNNEDIGKFIYKLTKLNSSILLLVEYENYEYLTYDKELPEIKNDYLSKCLKLNFYSIFIVEKLAYKLDNELIVSPLVFRNTNFKHLNTKIAWFFEENDNYIMDNKELIKILIEHNSITP